MATNFPTSLDSLTNPATTDQLNSPSHAAQHANANDAIEQLQAKVGVNSSAVTTSHDYKIAQLEAAITAGVSGTKLIYQDVRNQSGSSLTKGTPVRVTGSDGASGKLLIGAASNTTEAGSSKTFGIVSSTLPNNSNGQAITNGLLEGVDTTGAVDGDPVWLGPNGTKIFGLVNKPVAPAHLVYLGVVVRGGQQNTGSIFVSIQNGFEVEELHNVLITNIANKNALVYDSTTQLWKNYDLSNDFVLSGDLQNSLGDYIPLNALGQPSGPATLDADGNLIVPENKIIIEGATADAHELTLQAPDVVSDITVTLPNATGTLALTSDITTAISNLIDAAPDALNTLNELAAAINDDASYASTITTALGNKLDSTTAASTYLTQANASSTYLTQTSASSTYLTQTNASSTYAPIANPTFTGTVGGVTKSMVGLGNVDNTTDANKPVSIATQTALNLKANTADITELAQDAVGNSLSSVFTYNDSTGGIGIDNAQLSNFLLEGASGNSYGLIGTSQYLDVKNTNGYNKEIEVDITALETKLETDGFAKLASPALTGTPTAPTAAVGTDSTQVATTAFVIDQIDASTQPGALYQTTAPTSPEIGQIWIDSDDNVTVFDSNIIRRQPFTATAGQTNFVTTVPFIDGFEQVYFNGLLLLKTTDYTTSGTNTVILGSAAAVNDIIEVVTVTNLNSVNTYTQAETDALLAANTSVAPLSISANTNLLAKKRYFVTSASALTLTLPASPALNDEIQILDASGNASTYNITVARNGRLINGNAGNLIIDVNGGWYTLLYTGATYGWKVA
jgi:hypothetical protein